ncbi:S26 family signal peptidase [Streptomyces sp. NPDC093149]|uniref:S26 family signal peptidase n=1 Tax=Streptomyces sp. NPDC093149 TaxID=3366031 RepID=UPI00380C8587
MTVPASRWGEHFARPMRVPLLVGLTLLIAAVLTALLYRPAPPLVWLSVLAPVSWLTPASGRALLRGRWVVVTVRGASMQPTLRGGDRLLVRRGPVRAVGELAVLGRAVMGPEEPAYFEWIIKRVAAVPGDAIPRDSVPSLADVPETTVPSGRLVLLGDNRAQSFDSRRFGYYSAEEVLGVVVRPLGRAAHRSRQDRSRGQRRLRRRHFTGSNTNSCSSVAGSHDS